MVALHYFCELQMERGISISVNKQKILPILATALFAIAAAMIFLFSIHTMGVAFSVIGRGAARSILQVTHNPFIGLFIGLLTTALLQSSSTTTSMVVAAVASGSLELTSAVPIVMGANIGTTITSTIVSLSYITKSGEFRKAISAGTIHDAFNMMTVLLLFPLEIRYNLLTNLSSTIGAAIKLPESGPASILKGNLDFFGPMGDALVSTIGPITTLIFSFVVLLLIVKQISKLLYNRLIGDARRNFDDLIFRTKFKSFGWGFLITAVVQSSSLTTSLIVPLVATGKLRLGKAFQFVLGANLGTTITAILAALFKSEAAVSLAMAHFLFNLLGVSVFLLIPVLNKIPTFIAVRIGYLTLRYRLIGFAYILITFFALPFSLIYLSNGKTWVVDKSTKKPKTELVLESK